MALIDLLQKSEEKERNQCTQKHLFTAILSTRNAFQSYLISITICLMSPPTRSTRFETVLSDVPLSDDVDYFHSAWKYAKTLLHTIDDETKRQILFHYFETKSS